MRSEAANLGRDRIIRFLREQYHARIFVSRESLRLIEGRGLSDRD